MGMRQTYDEIGQIALFEGVLVTFLSRERL